MISKFFTSSPCLIPDGESASQMADRLGISQQEAHRIQTEDHRFTGYNDFGEEVYISPEAENEKQALINKFK